MWLATLSATVAWTGQQRAEERVRQTLLSFEGLEYLFGSRAARDQVVVVVDIRLDEHGVPLSASALTEPESLIPCATANAKKWRFVVDNRSTTIWATTFDGQQLWAKSFTGPTIKDMAPDTHGGLILVLSDTFGTSKPHPQRVQRIDGATGAVSWEYFSDDGNLSEVAVHPDGTIFVTDEEYHSANTYLVALDGLSGAANRWRLPWRYYQPYASGPIVRDDRSVQVLFNPHDADRTHLQLATVQATNAPPLITDLHLPGDPTAAFDPSLYRLIPQASGGLFVGQRRGGTNILRVDPGGVISEIVPLMASPLVSAGVGEVDYAVTDTVGRALIERYTDVTIRPYEVYDISFDPTTLSPGGNPWLSTDPYVSFRLISTDGGVHTSGQADGMFGANDNQVAPGMWAGLGAGGFMTLGGGTEVAQPSSYLAGGTDSTNGTWRRTIAVRCRPVDQSTAGAFGALHCYIVVERRDKTIRTIQGGELNGEPIGVLRVYDEAGERVGPNLPSDPNYYFSEKTGDQDVVDCLERNATVIDQMHLPYHFLGPNSNSTVVELMRVCGRTVALPAKAIGSNIPLGPWPR